MVELNPKEVCKIQVNILQEVAQWCHENHVKYFLADGTLLGAVRHQGYIPWDDDIDIGMLRADYEKFIREFNLNRSDSMRVLHSSIDPLFPYEFAKIADTTTKLVENTAIKYEIGINIDLFVFDYVNPSRIKKDYRKTLIYRKMLSQKNSFTNREMVRQGRPRTGIKRLLSPVARFLCKPVSVPFCTRHIDSVNRKISADCDGKWVADVCQRWFTASQVMQSQWFAEETELCFEGCCFRAPAKFHEVLTATYGDYMQLPPEEERVTHHDYQAFQL